MLKLFLASIATVGLFGASTLAADLPIKAPAYDAPTAAPPYNWSGPYIGATIGGAWTNGSLKIPGDNLYGGITEFIGGLEAGYNFQAGHFLFGVEGDFDWAAFDHLAITAPTLGSVSQHWISTVAGRVGVVNDRWLVYGKVGGGWVQSSATLNVPAPGWNGSSTDGGLLIGAGVEYGFKARWTVKLEYDYLTQSNWTSTTVPAVPLNRDVQMIKAGINYKLVSGGTEAAEVSKYHREPSEDEDLQKESQNPIADLVSVPFQTNTNFNTGPFNRTQEIFNIQPVVPLHINNDWNLISRTIAPLISQPSPLFDSSTNGIGDVTEELFFSPTHPGPLIWGAGPVATMPSANAPTLGTGKVLAGPGVVLVVTPPHWVIGVVANNQWSVAGDPLRPAVNSFTAQYFINYNMPHGWYLTSSPIVTSNWLAAPGQQWTVPIGGGFGRVFRIGDQPVNAQVQSFYDVARPTGAPDWQFRFELALLFPVK